MIITRLQEAYEHSQSITFYLDSSEVKLLHTSVIPLNNIF